MKQSNANWTFILHHSNSGGHKLWLYSNMHYMRNALMVLFSIHCSAFSLSLHIIGKCFSQMHWHYPIQTLSAFNWKMVLKWLLISYYTWGFQFILYNPFDKVYLLVWTLLIIIEPLQIRINLTIDIEFPMNFLGISCFDTVKY